MPSTITARAASLREHLLAPAALDARDRLELLRTAQRLRRAARDGTALPLLAGRHLAIAGGDGEDAAGALFERAATGLGARVSRIAPDLLRHDAPGDGIAAARLLARLYDAVDFHQGDARRALALQRQSGVPVYLALGGAAHPIRTLLDAAEGEDLESVVTSLVQAVLVETLG